MKNASEGSDKGGNHLDACQGRMRHLQNEIMFAIQEEARLAE
jgi:hypothetical protein